MTTEEKIKVMQAYVDGKKIQIVVDGCWKDWIQDYAPTWNWSSRTYRIKPEPKKPTYRPYKDTAEMIEDFKKRFEVNVSQYAMPLIWVKRKDIYEYSLITDYNDDAVCMSDMAWDFAELLEHYTYLDGTPCGKLVEE